MNLAINISERVGIAHEMLRYVGFHGYTRVEHDYILTSFTLDTTSEWSFQVDEFSFVPNKMFIIDSCIEFNFFTINFQLIYS